jgi:hypothetical protein
MRSLEPVWVVMAWCLLFGLLLSSSSSAFASDVTSLVLTDVGRSYYDYSRGHTYYVVSLVNNSSLPVMAPIHFVVTNISSPLVTVANPDGYTSTGKPFIDFSGSMGDGVLDPSERSASKTIRFQNPSKVRFSFTWQIVGEVNSPPVADAGLDQTTLVGDMVTLDGSGSSDMDGDSLTYSWFFTSRPAGSTATLSNPTAVNPTFTVDKPGSVSGAVDCS